MAFATQKFFEYMAQEIVIFSRRFAIASHGFPQQDERSRYLHQKNRNIQGQCHDVEGQCHDVEGQCCGIHEEDCNIQGQCHDVEGQCRNVDGEYQEWRAQNETASTHLRNGGSGDLSNLQILCRSYNSRKKHTFDPRSDRQFDL
ncbi:hypothetical protein ACQ4M3_11640 [Leptolyngbya sp. AN03gr2]|uniref:hypothetical protein n=1 Tax=unclassified Leptolyngbya TaxID=2650499 RepID=UPI003D31660E